MLTYTETNKIWSDLINLHKTKLSTGHIFAEQFETSQKFNFDYNMTSMVRKTGTGKTSNSENLPMIGSSSCFLHLSN
jgi:hypothetical protein